MLERKFAENLEKFLRHEPRKIRKHPTPILVV